MSRDNYIVRKEYTGAGNLATYPFTFKITAARQLLMVVLNAGGVETIRVRGTDVVEISSLSFDANDGGGTVILPANLATGYTLGLFLDDDAPLQDYQFRNKTSFTLRRFEDALDNIMGVVQTLVLRSKQALRIGDFEDEAAVDNKLPAMLNNADSILLVNSTADGFAFGPTVAEIVGGTVGIGYLYVSGDANTDGSWRLIVTAGNLLIEVRTAGVWTTKQEIEP